MNCVYFINKVGEEKNLDDSFFLKKKRRLNEKRLFKKRLYS